MNPQHAINSGLGATATESVGYPWNSRYTVASGNMLADFRANVTAESEGRLQVARLYEMTDDAGVRDMLSFMLVLDTMHQNQCLTAIEGLMENGLVQTPCLSSFPQELENTNVSYQFWNPSSSTEACKGQGHPGQRPMVKDNSNYWIIPNPHPLTHTFTVQDKLQ